MDDNLSLLFNNISVFDVDMNIMEVDFNLPPGKLEKVKAADVKRIPGLKLPSVQPIVSSKEMAVR